MLIVEDHGSMRAALRDLLQASYPSARILEAADGSSALEMCRLHRPSLVLTDIGLPDINGIKLVEQIREVLPDVRVIVVSQYSDRAYVEHARAAGALHYVTKDRIASDLLAAVAHVMRTGGGPTN